MEFQHTLGRPLTDLEILAVLQQQNPDKHYTIGSYGVIIESERDPLPLGPARGEQTNDEEGLRAMRSAKLGYGATELATATE